MNEDEEMAYERGQRAAYWMLLGHCLRELVGHIDDPLVSLGQRIYERENAIMVLRRICEDHGDNKWETGLNLADIIEKHLGNYLE